MQTKFQLKDAAKRAKRASLVTATLSTAQKNSLLTAMAEKLIEKQSEILEANTLDILAGREKDLSDAMLDRLLLTPERIEDIKQAILEIASLTDPVGDISGLTTRPNGIKVGKMRIPLGVIAMIYEARPNVTAEAAALCIKSGNGVILRGGSEAVNSNLAIAKCLHDTLEAFDLDPQLVTVIPDTSREVIGELLTLKDDIDLVIPRGGEGLIRYVSDNSRIPVIQHYKGICHLYVDKAANFEKAINILINGKCQKPSACNAFETLLVHQDIAEQFLPLADKALAVKQVTMHACPKAIEHLPHGKVLEATAESFDTEYLDYAINIKVIEDDADAIAHIQKHGSDHTEVIVSENYSTTQNFLAQVNSSVVMVNASSRFSDGNQLGLGSEIGISTSKLHSYGPMGLEALTTEKFIVLGQGEVRS